MPFGIQAIRSHTTSLSKIDIDAGATFMLRRVTDGHTGFRIRTSLSGTLVTLLNIKQHHTINQIALRHSADVGHRILAGKQQYIVAAVLRLPCGLQKVSVVFGLINIAADRRTERKI